MVVDLNLALRITRLLILAVALFGVMDVRANTEETFVPGEVVLKLTNTAELPGVAGSHALDPAPLSQFGTRPIYRLRILDGVSSVDRAAALIADSRVVYAEPNYVSETPEGRQRTPWAVGGDVGQYVTQWAPAVIRLSEAHAVTRGTGMTVAILDTGVDGHHPVLAGRLVSGYDFVDMDADPSEVGITGQDLVYGHGTHVAGIVALAAPEARLMPVRVLDRNGAGNIWILAEALAFAVDPDGDPATDDGADVINLSLGTTRRTSLLEEILAESTCAMVDDDNADDVNDERDDESGSSECHARGGSGVVVVAAAGNRGIDVREYPAAEAMPGQLAVAASTAMDTLASFSSFGPWVQVAAPGEGILSILPGGEYGTWSGTSMATPFAAAQAALIRASDPGLSAGEVAGRIVATAAGIDAAVPRRIDLAASLGLPSPAKGTCQGFLGAVKVDSLLVPRNASCLLKGTVVNGTIKVEPSASLTAVQVSVTGNVQADGALVVNLLADSKVGGSIQLKHGGSVTLDQVHTSGDVQLESYHAAIHVTRATINGNLQVVQNRGSVLIAGNTVQGNLQCKENNQVPIGEGNTVSGKTEDQCSNR